MPAVAVKCLLRFPCYPRVMFGIEAVLRFIAPFDCVACGQEGELLCCGCQEVAIRPLPGSCYRCLAPVAGLAVCGVCRPRTPFEHVWVAAEYGGAARQAVQALKFARARSAAGLIAGIMHRRLPALPGGTLVVAVPTANRRIRERGYDQAELIARRLAKARRLPHQKLLRRHGHSRQVGATRAERHVQLQNAFSFAPRPGQPVPQHVLLIDDVLTTGATIEAAAAVLKKAGAKHISAALFAQKIVDLAV